MYQLPWPVAVQRWVFQGPYSNQPAIYIYIYYYIIIIYLFIYLSIYVFIYGFIYLFMYLFMILPDVASFVL